MSNILIDMILRDVPRIWAYSYEVNEATSGAEPEEWKTYQTWDTSDPHPILGKEYVAVADVLAALTAALAPTDAPDLSDPVTVHVNMLRGTIAKPTVEQIIHLYGVDALAKALAPVIVREAAPYMTDLMVDPETIPDMEMEYDHRAGDDSDD